MKKEELKCRKCGKYHSRDTFPISSNGIRSKISNLCRIKNIYSHSKEVCKVGSYEEKVRDIKSAKEALEIAKKNEANKLNNGYKFVSSGIRSYVLTKQ